MDHAAWVCGGAVVRMGDSAATTGSLRQSQTETSPAGADRALGRLAEASLVTFSLDGTTVSAHRLVTRVTRDHLTTTGRLAAICQAAATLLDGQAYALRDPLRHNRAVTRDLIEQVSALHGSASSSTGGTRVVRGMLPVRARVVSLMVGLGDSPLQALPAAEILLTDCERAWGQTIPKVWPSVTPWRLLAGKLGGLSRPSPCARPCSLTASGFWELTTP